MTRGFFITGTDTDVGKTEIALGIMKSFQRQGLKVAAMKPVSAGCRHTAEGLRNEDALRLMQQASVELPYELVNPYAFEQPVAPHIAAAEAGTSMQIQPLLDAYRQIATQADMVVVEGAGGWLVPVNQTQTMADVAIALQLPVILVVAIRLGCLNHALLSMQSISQSGLKCAGWIANHLSEPDDIARQNIQTLQQRLGVPLLDVVQFATSGDIKPPDISTW